MEEELRAQHEAIAETQNELDLQRSRYRTLFEGVADAYIVTDEHGIIEEANDAVGRLLGVTTAHIIRRPLDSFIDPETRRELGSRLMDLPSRERLDRRALRLKAPDGRVIQVDATVSIFESPRDRRRSFCWLLRDVASRQESEESMRALNRSLNARVAQRTRELELALEGEQSARKDAEAPIVSDGRFARLSHEFRTPLHAVSDTSDSPQNTHVDYQGAAARCRADPPARNTSWRWST